MCANYSESTVTPKMMKAGIDAFWSSYDPEASDFEKETVVKIFCAMQRAREPSFRER